MVFDPSSDDRLLEHACNVFHDEYRRNYPTGGDVHDHDEAIRAALEAVISTVQEHDHD